MDTYYKILLVLEAVYSGANLKQELIKYSADNHAAKIKNHCFGILRNSYAINFIIKKLVARPSIAVKLNIILQIAIFEIKFSNKPAYAVTNDIVNFTKDVFNNDKFNSFVNGVSRNYIRQQEEFELLIQNDYSLKYNLPEWFITKLKVQNKANYKLILDGFNHHPAFGIRINQHKIASSEYLQLLTAANIEYGIIDHKIYLTEPCDVYQLPHFENGYISVQDIGAQYCLDLIQKHNLKVTNVLDACAAPGGKTCQLLENLDLKLLAIDIEASRIKKVEENLQRLGLKAKTLVADAGQQKWWDKQKFDLILADVPCSATGTIKRNPDIKVNRSEFDILNFVQVQRRIVNGLWTMLEDQGHMLYITCSIFNEENQANVEWFSSNLAGFKVIDELQIFPGEHNDSLYYALIQKIG